MASRELNMNRVREGLEQLRRFGSEAMTAHHPDFQLWQDRVEHALRELLPKSPYADRFRNLDFWLPRMSLGGRGPAWAREDQEAFDKDAKIAERLLLDALEELAEPQAAQPPSTDGTTFVDISRIRTLADKKHGSYDFSRLVRLCEELNVAYATGCYFAVAALTRAVIDHVPPVFGMKSFSEVASNYAGARSFKDAMGNVDRASRKIADSHLHTQIRKKEDLPTQTQVNFSQELDFLLGEIIRIS